MTLKHLLDMGFDLLETDSEGWNCLFFCVLEAQNPNSSKELEALLFLLHRFADICARDRLGKTIFDHLDESIDDHREGILQYRRDLWYRGIERMNLLHGCNALSRCRHWDPHFGELFTPLHSHALRYLDHWDYLDYWPQVKAVLKKHPWSEHEKKEMIRWFSDAFSRAQHLTDKTIMDMARFLGLSPDPLLTARRRRGTSGWQGIL